MSGPAAKTVIEADLRARRGELELVAGFRSDAPITGVVGPSGAGKTTLLDALAGLVPGTRGRLVVGGVTLLDSERGVALPPHLRRIGYVFQDSRLFPHLDVAQNLAFGRAPPSADGGPSGEAAPDRDSVVEALELASLLSRRPSELSGGEARRVALGRALLTRPRLLLLDEPLSALDVGLRAQIRRYLVRVHERFAVPLLYVGHDLEELLGLTRRFLVVAEGRAIACGDYFELLGRADVFAVADRLGLGNVLDVVVVERDEQAGITRARLAADSDAAAVTLSMPPWALEPGTRLHVALRPQDVLLAKSAPSEISAQNALEGEVDALLEVQGRVIVRVDVAGAPILAELTPRARERLGLARGEPVVCLFKTHALRRVGHA